MFNSLPGITTVREKLEDSVNNLYKSELNDVLKKTKYPYYEHKFNYTWIPKEGERVVMPMLRKAVSL